MRLSLEAWRCVIALSRVKTWSAGEILSASDLNAEFNSILNNATSLISPATGSWDLNGNELVLDADADTSITSDTDDQIDFRIGGTDRLSLLATTATTTLAWTFDANTTVGTDTTTRNLLINGPAGSSRMVAGQTAGVSRWRLFLGENTPESGANAGSDFFLDRVDDAGTAVVGTVLWVRRSDGATQAGDSPTGGFAGADVWNFAEVPQVDNVPVVTTTGAQTLTNKTLTSPVISQVVFPSTQVPSADANTLDDYEEGTWTPGVSFQTPGDLSVTYSGQVGTYTKVGNNVTLRFHIVTTSFTHSTASGNLLISDLPFEATASLIGAGALFWQGITKTNYTQMCVIPNAGSVLNIQASGSGQNTDTIDVGDVPSGGAVVLGGTISYKAA